MDTYHSTLWLSRWTIFYTILLKHLLIYLIHYVVLIFTVCFGIVWSANDLLVQYSSIRKSMTDSAPWSFGWHFAYRFYRALASLSQICYLLTSQGYYIVCDECLGCEVRWVLIVRRYTAVLRVPPSMIYGLGIPLLLYYHIDSFKFPRSLYWLSV